MSDTKVDIVVSSKTFPTTDDMAQWDALSPAEQRAFIEESEEAGFRSGVASAEMLEDRLARVRAVTF